MGGLGLAFGLALGLLLIAWGGYLRDWDRFSEWWAGLGPIAIASVIVLVIGAVDDLRGMGPRLKLLGQASAVLVLYFGGVRISNIVFLGFPIRFDTPSFTVSLLGYEQVIAPIGLVVTLFWFLACMNVWNLIDGMDGLASGVGLLVSGTLMLVAIHHGNPGVAFLAASLAGSLAGFLLYNWHPACIFLGDSGSLLIGLLIGVIGVQGSLKGPSAISILFPILAMGLPISDTAMAIFRRWVRNLPLSSADRRHVHHLLIGLGLNPRQAAVLLYCFSAFLCGVVLLGVALQNEVLALVLGISGCLAFLLILMSRRDELATLRADFLARLVRGRQERFAAKVTWEAIQRIELVDEVERIWQILQSTCADLGCDGLKLTCHRDGRAVIERESSNAIAPTTLAEPAATFRLSSGHDQILTVSLRQPLEAPLAADIAFRFAQRLSLATAERLERLMELPAPRRQSRGRRSVRESSPWTPEPRRRARCPRRPALRWRRTKSARAGSACSSGGKPRPSPRSTPSARSDRPGQGWSIRRALNAAGGARSMDGIQPYAVAPSPAHHPAAPVAAHPAPGPHFAASPPSHALPVKTTGDYLRAIRRKAWLVVAVGVLVSVAGALLVLRMPAVYKATAEVTIEPPRYDQGLGRIMKAESLVQSSTDEIEKYVPDKIAFLHSKALAEKVVRDPGLASGQPVGPVDDAAAELAKNLYSRNRTGTHYYTISLEGRDPARVAKTLHLLLELFRQTVHVESTDTLEQSRRYAGQTLERLSKSLQAIHAEIYKLTRSSAVIAPGGGSVKKEELQAVNQALITERTRYGDLQRQIHIESMRPDNGRRDGTGSYVASLREKREGLARRFNHQRAKIRGDDPALRAIYDEILQIDAEIGRLQRAQADAGGTDAFEAILSSAREQIQALEADQRQLLEEMKDAHPTFDRYLELVAQREMMQRQIVDTQQKLSDFEAMARTQKEPVNIVVPPVEPVLPERPKKALYIAVIMVFGFSFGAALAGLLEHVDHSVKVPEHLTSGLALPLLGVVTRIRRTARVHRGGHLWILGAPDSAAADAYRNIHASLVGVAHTRGPIVTLLITSTKAGEGKSTTALNLAATCARAGERTLLVDVDLRRPSLADVFPHEDRHLGLADVLRGELPWQRVVVPTELPNLDFIPTGDTREVPIEILGSLELRQLLLSLSQHHYDRVILDGPAVLGLADCRMLGRIVDASLLVVRSGRQGLRPLRRAKEMLEQSQVRLAGIVFNGICEGLEDWSSCAPGSRRWPSRPTSILDRPSAGTRGRRRHRSPRKA